jgi:hypothetical protein
LSPTGQPPSDYRSPPKSGNLTTVTPQQDRQPKFLTRWALVLSAGAASQMPNANCDEAMQRPAHRFAL